VRAPTDLAPVLEPIRTSIGMPGIAAAVVRDGQLVAAGAVGIRALGDTTRVRLDDRFLIGSCAKSMLRVLVARLVEAGTVSFDTKLGDALPDTPMLPVYRDVTIGQVLSFRGGIQPYTQIGPRITPWLFQLSGSPVEQREAFTAHVLSEDPAATPGTEEVYSNAGYGIVAHLLEHLAGKPWETLVAEQVFQPLGMTTALVGSPTSADRPEGVRGHFRTDAGYELTPGPRQPLASIAPAGGVSCSVTDFARFAGELALIEAGHGGVLLKPETTALLRSIDPVSGAGEGSVFLGGEGTFTAAFAVWPSHGTAVVVETNGGESDAVCESTIEKVRVAVAPDLPAQRSGAPAGPLGLSFVAKNDDAWEITDVRAGSPAAMAGVAPGDFLVAVNGVPLARLAPPERRAALQAERVALTVKRGSRTVECSLVRPPAPRP
jgi:CubicO group peptidase (beta-lactamase class C family)